MLAHQPDAHAGPAPAETQGSGILRNTECQVPVRPSVIPINHIFGIGLLPGPAQKVL